MNKEINGALEAAKALPPSGILAVHAVGIDMNTLVLYGSGLLIALQIFFLIRKEVYIPWKNRKAQLP